MVFFAAPPPPLAGSTWFTTEMKREGALWFQLRPSALVGQNGLLGKAVRGEVSIAELHRDE